MAEISNSQSFTCLISSLDENLDIETASNNFIEDIIDKSQITLKFLLSGIKILNIIEIWKIRRIGGLSHKYNIVILLDDGTHLCIYLKTITKGSNNNEVIHQNTNQQNRFGIAFFTAKTAVNIALKTNSDLEINEFNQKNDNIVPLQKNLIEQITSPCVTKVRGAPSKKRLRSAMEISKRRVLMQEIADENNVQPIKQQRKCLLYGKFGHYQEKCQGIDDNKHAQFQDITTANKSSLLESLIVHSYDADFFKRYRCKLSEIQTYLNNYVIPIPANFSGQLYIRKAIVKKLESDNSSISKEITDLLPFLEPLHLSLNTVAWLAIN
ncbi:hypothetical protein C1646_765222 [Rhizophagus diaphanus]|nr:hypothetical protein C1646_765222 [Rhizophagus diaphanus] [Rhizophagus sp. MUCL 43196]